MNKIIEVKLTRDKIALIDEEDLDKVSQYSWYCLKTGYAATSVGGRKNKKMIYLHRLIMDITDPKISVDHINRNKLDNRKVNLRTCTHAQNCKNQTSHKVKKTSIYKGVLFDKNRSKWIAQIRHNMDKIFLGRFDTEREAAIAYNNAAIKFHGEFAQLNTL